MNILFKLIIIFILLFNISYATQECNIVDKSFTTRVISEFDDAEERSSGYMYIGSSDLELTEDGSTQQTIGIRFQNIQIPQGATITNAYIRFTVDEVSTDITNLTIFGEDVDNSSQFTLFPYNITNRTKTSHNISWSPPPWESIGDSATAQTTPNLKDIIQEIINRSGWRSGNALSFIIEGSGRRTAESFEGDPLRAPTLYIEYLGCEDENETKTTAICYALTDNSDKLYKVSMLPNASLLPTPSIISISETFNGEGSAYRASDNKFYAFKAVGDNIGPSDLYTIDVDSGEIHRVKDNIILGTVDGAEFYFNPSLNKEILYVISGENNSKLYAFDPEDWSLLDGYPKDTNTNLSSLAVNPINGIGYGIDDYNYDGVAPKLYQIDLQTGETTYLATLQALADAEGLAFASDGNLYIEDEGRYGQLVGKKLYKVDLNTGELIPSAITDASGDIEGLSCNGTLMAIEKPSIKIEDSNISEGNSRADVNLTFRVSLSRPSDEPISFTFRLIDGNNSNPKLNAILNSDYLTPPSNRVVIDANSTEYIISIPIIADNVIESNESFYIKLEDINGSIIEKDLAVGTILDDDTQSEIGCIESAFMFQNIPTDISILNLIDGNMTQIKDNVSSDNINALGFNKKDGFFWGYNYSKNNGTITRIGYDESGDWSSKDFLIAGLEEFASYVGDIDNNGHLYLKGTGSNRRVVVIDLDPNSPTYLTKIRDFYLNFTLVVADWAFNPKDNLLYGVNNGGSTTIKYLYKIDPQTGTLISRQNTYIVGNRTFGAGFFDADGFYYIYDNYSGEIFRIDVARTSKAILFARGGTVTYNDGAMCTDTKFKFDFGDLPQNYPTKLEKDGARHSLPRYQNPTIYLGDTITDESEGAPSTDANTDLGDDGVKLLDTTLQDRTLNGGSTVRLTIKSVGEGYLSGWIDFNGDGDFNDTNEEIAKDIFSSGGEISLDVNIPSSTKNITTYARFRYSTQQNLTPSGVAIDGEVEDYRVYIAKDLEEFECSENFYFSNRGERGFETQDSGATWLHSFRPTNTLFTTIGGGFESSDGGYNALGYNIKDNFLYALYKNELLLIDKNGKIKNLGIVERLPNMDFEVGAFDREGYYYVGAKELNSTLYKIDISTKEVIEEVNLSIDLNSSVKLLDMAIDNTDRYFYGMLVREENSTLINDRFIKIDKSSGQIEILGDNYKDISYISLIYIDANNKIILAPNSGGVYEFDLNSSRVYFLNQTLGFGIESDGTNCPDANFTLPPHIPRLSISDVSKAEGDSAETIFEFKVSIDAPLPYTPFGLPALFYYRVINGDGNIVVPPRGVATTQDGDFRGEDGVGVDFNVFSQTRTHTIGVVVYGDKKIEPDEEFYVDIYFPTIFPSDLCVLGKSRGVGVILNDDMKFKVVRVDGNLDNSTLYTQVANRDFDYSIISYSANGLNRLEDITIKVDLVDNTTNETLYTAYKYIDSNTRIDILDENDLAIPKATKDASFRVSFLKDLNGSIAKGDYSNREDYELLLNSGYTETTQDSSDHFAIRPTTFNISIGDNNGSIIYLENNSTQTEPLELVAGHNYYIGAKAIDSSGAFIEGYTTSSGEINTTLIFKSNQDCKATRDIQKSYTFTNGTLNGLISHTNVGKYTLHLEDKNWSSIDRLSGDCIENSSEIPDNKNAKVGCDIVSNAIYNDLDLKFNPYKFKVASYIENIPNTQRDYVYMNNLDKSLNMGISLITNIQAEDKSGNRLTNFTSSCEAREVDFRLDFNLSTDTNSSNRDILITTIDGTPLTFKRVVGYNGQSLSILDVEDTNLSKKVSILADNFLDVNEGNSSIRVVYNLSRDYAKPANPVEITFNRVEVNSSAISRIEDRNHTANGSGEIGISKLLYYATIAPDRENYEDEFDGVAKTPINALIYCKNTIAWCSKKIGSNGLNNVKTVDGWYRAIGHDSNIDGKVNNFIISEPLFEVTPQANELPNFLDGVAGRIDNILTGYSGNSYPATVIVELDVTDWLKYHKDPARAGVAFWKNTFRDKNSTWSGVGEAGNQVDIKTTTKPAKKISW